MVVNYHVGTRIWTGVLWKSKPVLLTIEQSLQTPDVLIFLSLTLV